MCILIHHYPYDGSNFYISYHQWETVKYLDHSYMVDLFFGFRVQSLFDL